MQSEKERDKTATVGEMSEVALSPDQTQMISSASQGA